MIGPHRLTPMGYMSKAVCSQTCPMKYYWQHYHWLGPKDRPDYFRFGSATHKAVEIGITQGWPVAQAIAQGRLDLAQTLGLKPSWDLHDIQALGPKELDLMYDMLQAFEQRWTDEHVRSVLSTEYSVQMPLADLGIQSEVLTHWVVKADFIYEDDQGLWVGDLKTTSGYGPSTAKYYHSSPQTKTFFHVLKHRMPALKGTKIFVVTKQKVRCGVETIYINDRDRYQAQLMIQDSVRLMDKIHQGVQAGEPCLRSMTNCINSYGSECPYIPLCLTPNPSPAYIQDLVTNWYLTESPDKHLELETKS